MPQTSKLYKLHSTEDEMIIIHNDDGFAATLYATCPEQARDFSSSHKRSKLTSVEAWKGVLRSFQKSWTSKDTEY